MSVAFYSDEKEIIHRKIANEANSLFLDGLILNGPVDLELDRCAKWITDNNFSKIALQFPDNLLGKSLDISLELAYKTQKQMFVLADTSYGSCCVDEIAAEHIKADAVIHFGHTCLSPVERLPVLYVLPRLMIDVQHVISSFKVLFPDITTPVILYPEISYYHAISEIVESLKEYENIVISRLVFPNEKREIILKENEAKIVKNQRYFILPKTRDLKDYAIFYIGHRNETITNVMLCLNKCKFYLYNVSEESTGDNTCNMSRFLGRRNYYIERTRDAKIIGILVGTLGVSNYISTIKRLREAITAANKKAYVIVIGKRNVAKLANFVEVEVFVNVACLESTIVDCSGFLQPIITPYELEIALNIREWTADFITDFNELLPDGAHHVPLSEMKKETDVSLITGRVRTLGLSDSSEESKDESTALVQRDEMTISEIHSQGAGEFLSQRSWKGLEQNLGKTPVANIEQGRKGIASEYEDERLGQN